ncbi:hypothetical protein [Actinomarinicola tropica]|uniref:Uncharacterized protein n=1 Tax=Actinomarinicola tropica TaxID=2789776 RepID=A0A5Q2RFB9_9ACTN|nr:hypothetical protein [Actinomarinicola tropica]QGG94383.1 hypothetical protein GH723_04285 [Actinomarinicola tropica]
MTIAYWTGRRWGVAAATAVAYVLVVGVPTAMIPTPVFGREIPPTWWSWPALLVSAVLAGLLAATYVASPVEGEADELDRPTRTGLAGGMLTFFAVGCPVCNKLVLLALGTSGALNWFEPVQPLLQVAAIAALAWALRTRLRTESACVVPVAS